MANANKRKGDVAERAVRDYLSTLWPTKKTRAGFDDDLGDVLADTPAGRLVVQVKDVASPAWKTWYAQLADQVRVCRELSDGKPVLGGILVHKYRGHSQAEQWHAICRLEEFTDIIDQAYQAGRTNALENMHG